MFAPNSNAVRYGLSRFKEVAEMAARKRASTQSKLLNRAVKAGRSALLQAQRRLPPDVRKQIERTVKDGQKTVHAAIKQVELRLDRTARQADLEKAMKRLDEISKQVRNMAAAAAAARTAPPARKPATRNAATRKTARRSAASRKATPKKTATRAPRRARMRTRPNTVPPPNPNPEGPDIGESFG
jgi:polyhydroxyalkanoate synthesis regulator phasin